MKHTKQIIFSSLVVLVCSMCPKALDISNIDSKKLLEFQQSAGSSSSGGVSQNFLPFNSMTPAKVIENADNSLDPKQYYIGGGDEFYISLLDNPAIKFTGTVNQQGELYIAELGIKKLGKITLVEAEKSIKAFIQTKLKKTTGIYVALSKVKKVTISINGAVSEAGTYTLPGTYRVLDALRTANGSSLPMLGDCNYREVHFTNSDTSGSIDLFNYLLKNDITANPYIYPGDNLTLEYATKRVFLNAPLKSMVKGWVPIKDGESLLQFISLFKFDASADTSAVVFQSVSDNNSSIRRVFSSAFAQVILQDHDIITVAQKKGYFPFFSITVSGEVSQPGTYPINKDSTTVGDILKMAGGPTSFSNVKRIVIVRRSKAFDAKATDSIIASPTPQLQLSMLASMRPEISTGYSKMSLTKDYSIIEVKDRGATILLYPNDNIIIPRNDAFVYVSGNVKRPGGYAYNPGSTYAYYVDLAGGYTRKADKGNMFGMRSFGAVSQIIDLSEIVDGDIIVVPDSQQAKLLTMFILPIITATATTVGVLLGIYSVSRSK